MGHRSEATQIAIAGLLEQSLALIRATELDITGLLERTKMDIIGLLEQSWALIRATELDITGFLERTEKRHYLTLGTALDPDQRLLQLPLLTSYCL